MPMEVRVGPDTVVIRNQIRRHEIPVDEVVRVEFTDFVSGWGRRVLLRTTMHRKRIRVAALATDNGASTETMDLVIRERQAQRRR